MFSKLISNPSFRTQRVFLSTPSKAFRRNLQGQSSQTTTLPVKWQPLIDLKEDEESFYVHADLPGFEKKDIKVELFNDHWLQISGERISGDNKGKKSIMTERSYGQFVRQLTLSPGIDPHNVKATLNHGVLDIMVPKPTASKGAKMVKIPIE